MREYQYFKLDEFACKCGCGTNRIDESFVAQLDELRRRYGKPLRVSSGYRCPKHNAAVSSTGEDGPHTTGFAVDFGIDRGEALALLRVAMSMPFTGIGVNQKGNGRFIHVDSLPNAPNQPRPTIWSY